jgi:Rad3-related DNA helicase
MSEFSWGPELVDGARPEHKPEAAAQTGTLALSADEFSALEERILKAVNLVKRERLARAAAEERAALAESKASGEVLSVEKLKKDAENLQKEVEILRAERDNVRQRVERLLSQLDALEV